MSLPKKYVFCFGEDCYFIHTDSEASAVGLLISDNGGLLRLKDSVDPKLLELNMNPRLELKFPNIQLAELWVYWINEDGEQSCMFCTVSKYQLEVAKLFVSKANALWGRSPASR